MGSDAPITDVLATGVIRITSGISRFANGLVDVYHGVADGFVGRTAKLVGGLARSVGERLLGGNGTPNPRDGPQPPLAPPPISPHGPSGACSGSVSGAGCSEGDGPFYKEFAVWSPRSLEPPGDGGLFLNAGEAARPVSYHPLVGERPG